MSVLSVLLLFSGVVYASGTGRVTVGELKSMLDAKEAVVLIDVRTPSEHADGHIPGSILMPLNTLEGVTKLPEGGRVVIYCHSGRRSQRALQILEAKGFTGLVDLEGGIVAWKAAGGSVVTGK